MSYICTFIFSEPRRPVTLPVIYNFTVCTHVTQLTTVYFTFIGNYNDMDCHMEC